MVTTSIGGSGDDVGRRDYLYRKSVAIYAQQTEPVKARLRELRTMYKGQKLILGVDRLDYIKGVSLSHLFVWALIRIDVPPAISVFLLLFLFFPSVSRPFALSFFCVSCHVSPSQIPLKLKAVERFFQVRETLRWLERQTTPIIVFGIEIRMIVDFCFATENLFCCVWLSPFDRTIQNGLESWSCFRSRSRQSHHF